MQMRLMALAAARALGGASADLLGPAPPGSAFGSAFSSAFGPAPRSDSPSAAEPLDFVDPLIGSVDGGNVFAGATLPFGLAKAVADVDGQNAAGFSLDGSNVTGFSALHDSGTGGNPSLGNFPLFPQLCPGDDVDRCPFRMAERKVGYRRASVRAGPDRFALELESGIDAEMTVSRRTALFRFTFPDGGHPLVLVDLRDLWQSRQNASVAVDPGSGRMVGNGTLLPSFGAGSYAAHFCVDFFGARVHDTGVWVNSRGGTEPKRLFLTRGFNLFYLEGGGWARFAGRSVTARVGLSFRSADQACRSAEAEAPDPLADFDALVDAARAEWRRKLSAVGVDGASTGTGVLRTFWSGVYRAMMSPQNYTGENPHWDTGRPYFDSFYCLWDSFRTLHLLLTLVDPRAQAQMVQSLLDTYRHEGWLPDCRMSLCQGWTQGGSSADVVLADALAKNVSLDRRLALEAAVADAEREPLEWARHGRGGLGSWRRLGFIPARDFDAVGFGTDSRSVSRTLEYAYNDFCVAALAAGAGEPRLRDTYLRRSMNWRNLWRADQPSVVGGRDSGFRGFPQPRYANGSWAFQDPAACSPLDAFCSLTANPSETFEGSIWQYHFHVPHAVASLIHLGGDDALVARLDFLHESGLADVSNEPVFLPIFLYHYAGRPALSARRLYSYLSAFNDTPRGLPGNDDSGAMSAFFVLAALGFFPVAGQDIYLITPPLFREVSVTNPLTRATATVRCLGFDPVRRNLAVQSAELDGQPWSRSWIGHRFFTHGGTLELRLGPDESDWGTRAQDRPPSWG